MDSPNFHSMIVRYPREAPVALQQGPELRPTVIYGTATRRSAELFQELPEELLEHILDFLTPETGNLLTVDQRASLTVESFASAPVHSPDEVNDVNIFVLSPSSFPQIARL
jgi:hypothetical protein